MSFSSRYKEMQLKIVATPHGDDLVIALDGMLSAADAGTAQIELLKLSGACTGRVVLDCTKLTYVASIGLRALLALHRNTTGRTKGLWLAGLTPAVRHILEIAGLYPHFTHTETVEQALGAGPAAK